MSRKALGARVILAGFGFSLLLMFQNFTQDGFDGARVLELRIVSQPGMAVQLANKPSECESKGYFLSKDSDGYGASLRTLMEASLRQRSVRVETESGCRDGRALIKRIAVLN